MFTLLARPRPRVFHTVYGPGATLPILTEQGTVWVQFDGNDEFIAGRRRVRRSDLEPEAVVSLATMRGVS